MDEIYTAFLTVAVLVFTAEVVSSALHRFKAPDIVGQIIAGMIMGPYALGGLINQLLGYDLIVINQEVVFVAEFSVLLLIFASGLEHGLASLKSAGVLGALAATFGALFPFFVTYLVYDPIYGNSVALFLGTALGATSLAAVVPLLEGLEKSTVNFLLSAAAFDDVVSLLILSVVIAYVTGEAGGPGFLVFKIVELLGLWVVILLVSAFLVPRMADRLGESYVHKFSLVVLFGLTVLMVSLGYSPVIAAFVAGVALAGSYRKRKIEEMTSVLLSVFGPVFFAYVGAKVNLRSINLAVILLALELTALATVFKILGVLLFAFLKFKDFRTSFFVSLGMVPRGETGLVIAYVGTSMGVLGSTEFEAVVLTAVLTTLIGAYAFKLATTSLQKKEEQKGSDFQH